MFTTIFGFIFLSPMMAKNQVQQQLSVFQYPATKAWPCLFLFASCIVSSKVF